MTATHTRDWTPENQWREPDEELDRAELDHADYMRARACVQALRGVGDPAAMMAAVRTLYAITAQLTAVRALLACRGDEELLDPEFLEMWTRTDDLANKALAALQFLLDKEPTDAD